MLILSLVRQDVSGRLATYTCDLIAAWSCRWEPMIFTKTVHFSDDGPMKLLRCTRLHQDTLHYSRPSVSLVFVTQPRMAQATVHPPEVCSLCTHFCGDSLTPSVGYSIIRGCPARLLSSLSTSSENLIILEHSLQNSHASLASSIPWCVV